MKSWTFGKMMAVAGGGFVAFILITVVAINSLAGKKRSSQQPAVRPANAPVAAAEAPVKAPVGAPVKTASAQTAQSVGPDIVSVQLESAQSALREAREETRSLEQRLATALANRDESAAKQTQTLIGEIQALGKRIRALEEDRLLTTDVKVVRAGDNTVNEGTEAQPAAPSQTHQYTPPKGFVVRAELGNRVWLSDGKREISVLKDQEPPKATPPQAKPKTAHRSTVTSAYGQ